MPTTPTRAATSKAYVNARGEVKRAVLGEINDAKSSPGVTADAAYYSTLKIPELKDLLRSKGLKVSGKKANLIKRLVSSKAKSAKPPDAVPGPTNVCRKNVIIDLTSDSPRATPAKSVAEAAENEADTIADSLGALKLQNVGVDDAERNRADDKENLSNGRGWEIEEGLMHTAKEEKGEDDTAATVSEARRKANDRIQKQHEEEMEENLHRKIVGDFKEGMCAGGEEKRKDDNAAATVADERSRTDERIQKQRKEEEDKLKREAAKEEERRRLELSEYVHRKRKEAQEVAIQEQAKATDRLIAKKCKHKEQVNLIERTLRAAKTEKFAHYDVLAINHSSSAAEVNRAYQKLALKLHPDKLGQNATPKSREAFNAISNAYEVLNDPSSRSKYDREQGSVRGGDPPPAGVPRDQPSSFWNTIHVGTRITVQDSAHCNSAQGSIQRYDERLDQYYVMLDNTTCQMLFEKSALFQNVCVDLRNATAKGLRALGAWQSTAILLRYKTCSNGRCYEVRVFGATQYCPHRTVDLQPNQFIIPSGTVVRLKYGNRYHGMIVGWTESFDQHTGADVSYYQVQMSDEAVQNVYMMNIEL